MDRLPTRVNRADPEYQKRHTHNQELIDTLRERLDNVSEGGGGKYVERHRGRGKMLARERIEKIIQSIDESYNSTNTIKLLYVNKLIEEGSYDKSIEVLNNISGSQSTATKELVYSLKAKAFAHKGLCEKSKEYSKKITSHDSIKEISKDDVLVCENQ